MSEHDLTALIAAEWTENSYYADAEGPDCTKPFRPSLKRPVPRQGCGNCRCTKAGTDPTHRDSGVDILVGVDADHDLGCGYFNHASLSRREARHDPTSGQDCDGRGSLKLL